MFGRMLGVPGSPRSPGRYRGPGTPYKAPGPQAHAAARALLLDQDDDDEGDEFDEFATDFGPGGGDESIAPGGDSKKKKDKDKKKKKKLGKIKVKLDKPWYVAGEAVTGVIFLANDAPISVEKVYVKAKGKEKVVWEEHWTTDDYEGQGENRRVRPRADGNL